jgi:murein DD-endopeptidase MepM/ murein hydrolase activator NlpD
MTRFLIAALVALALAGAASAESSPLVTLPGADAPNLQTVLLPQLLMPPAQPEQLSYDQLLPIWQGAAQAYNVPWSVLAAIDKVESNFGQNMGPSSAGAIGWMQFMPDTWARWGVDANGDGVADPWNAEDAIYSAARYLAATGGASDIAGAVFSYNHAQWYVDEVLQLAQQYEGGGVAFSNTLDTAQQSLDTAKQAVLDASTRLIAARAAVTELQQGMDALTRRVQAARSLSGRLAAEKDATLLDYRIQSAQAEADARAADLQTAQEALTSARDAASGAAFASGTSSLLGAPAYSDGYVFPVAGGAGVVSVGHTHHDYPAADIAAPQGTQLFALSNGSVTQAWPSPEGNCGIGFTIATTDGLTWTYCHLSYLEPAVTVGATLTAGQPVGLVGQTGHADGPHLHLQLEPATGYPQDEPWFQSFAGSAFSWSDTVQSRAAQSPVFAVMSADPAAGRSLASASEPAPSAAVVFFTTSGG